MWWEYLVIFACIGIAVAYLLWMISRSFGGKGGSCGSNACRCAHSSADEDDRRAKVVPLVQLETPKQ